MPRSARNMIVLLALCALCVRIGAEETRPDDYITRARQLLRTLYPHLSPSLAPTIRDHHRLGDADTMNLFLMELDAPEKSPAAAVIRSQGDVPRALSIQHGACAPGCRCSNPVLWADFGFDWQTESKELIRLWVGGPAVVCQQEKLAEEINRHPEWSHTRIMAALKNAGAKFGPDSKAEFLRGLPIGDLKPFVGDLEVLSAEFYEREVAPGGTTPKASLTWTVRAKWHGPDGRLAADCVLTFEPFEGRLLMYTREVSPRER
jgi:hypothetical protein